MNVWRNVLNCYIGKYRYKRIVAFTGQLDEREYGMKLAAGEVFEGGFEVVIEDVI